MPYKPPSKQGIPCEASGMLKGGWAFTSCFFKRIEKIRNLNGLGRLD